MKPDPFARFARKLATAFQELADDLETADEEVSFLPEEPKGDIAEGRVLGKRQRQIVEIAELKSEQGLKTAAIASRIGYEVPNVYLTLRGMEGSGIVEMVPNSSPQRWRLAPRYRISVDPYMEIAAQIRLGEWATYGDISIAYRGDNNAARAIGRAAATIPDFPNPHRLLLEGGRIPEGWHSDDGRGREECRRRLEADGVLFTPDGRAESAFRVTWDMLKERMAA